MTEDAPISSDPRAVEILSKVLYHNHDALRRVVNELIPALSTVDAVIWLTKANERLGWKEPLWCRFDQVEQLFTTQAGHIK